MALNEEVQEYVRKAYVNPARQRGETLVRIKAGDVHRSLHWSNRVPSVCTTLASQKFQRETGLKLVSKEGPPSGYGTRAVFTYNLSPADSTSSRHDSSDQGGRQRPSLEALYGVLSEVFRELGGGEKFLREERQKLHFRNEARKKRDEA